MSFDIDTSELNAIAVQLGAAGPAALPLARAAVQKSSADIKRDGKLFAPVDTGFLRNSITYETQVSDAAAEGEIGPTASYGAYVEFGTSRMAPRAYMGPAFDRHAGEFEQAIQWIANQVGL